MTPTQEFWLGVVRAIAPVVGFGVVSVVLLCLVHDLINRFYQD